MESGYIRVEYIQNIAGSRIETNYIPTQNDEFEIEYMQDQFLKENNFQCLFSAGTGTYQLIALAYGSSATNYYCKYFASGDAQILRSLHSINTWVKMKITSSGIFTANGVSVTSPYEQEIDGSSNALWIFRRKNNYNRFYGKLKAFRITNNGTLKMNLIPCIRSVDNVAGVYDTVSNVFYSSPDGLEPFEHGDPVVDNYLISNASGDIVHFRTALEEPLESCKVTFAPVQAGSGDPSPSNVRAISGWNSITVKHCGKNLFDLANANISDRHITNDSGVVVSDNGNSYCQTPIKVAPSIAFTLSGYTNEKVLAKRFYYLDKNKNFISRSNGWSALPSHTETTPQNCQYLQIQTERMEFDDWTKMQLEYGSSYSFYEPYHGDETTVSWQTALYGGYVDLATGELVQTHKLITLTGEESNASKTWDSYTILDSAVYAPNNNGYYVVACSHTSNIITGVTMWSTATAQGGSGQDVAVAGTQTSQIRYRDRNNMGDSLESYRAYLKSQYDNGTPVQIVMKLVTPVHYQLTPQQINTFKGINNFWSEAGIIDVSYCFKDAPEMLKLRRQIELSSPHVEKITSGNTVDSLQIAAFRTDMTAPLKECKVSFEPKQAGQGNPSPTNIREITGLAGVTVKRSGVNLLQCDKFSNNTGGVVSFTGTRNADGEIESIQVVGTTANSNTFQNLNNESGKFKIFNGRMATYGYSDQAGIITAGSSDPYLIDGASWWKANYADWNIYDIDDQRYNDDHTKQNTSAWYRLQTYPSKTGTEINTTVYPMVCLASDQGCEYEPYKGESYSVDWQSTAGTLYGGYIDLVTGELVKTWHNYTFTGDETFYTGGSWITFQIPFVDGVRMLASNPYKGICSHYPYAPYKTGCIGVMYDERNCIFDGTLRDAEGWKQFVKDQYDAGTPLSISYKLAEPMRYQLSAQTIRTLRGRNNIWCTDDSCSVDVKYWTHLSNIPSLYQRVEYLGLDGYNARIDTGVAGNDNTLEFDYTFMAIDQQNYLSHLGNYVNENTICWRVIQATTNAPRMYYFTSNNRKAGSSNGIYAVPQTAGSILNVKVHFHLSYKNITVTCEDGYTASYTAVDDGTTAISDRNIAIGSSSTTATSNYTKSARFYGAFKIWSQGQLIRNYIPCYRKSDHKSGFYDTVNDTFNPSIGSADFVLPS